MTMHAMNACRNPEETERSRTQPVRACAARHSNMRDVQDRHSSGPAIADRRSSKSQACKHLCKMATELAEAELQPFAPVAELCKPAVRAVRHSRASCTLAGGGDPAHSALYVTQVIEEKLTGIDINVVDMPQFCSDISTASLKVITDEIAAKALGTFKLIGSLAVPNAPVCYCPQFSCRGSEHCHPPASAFAVSYVVHLPLGSANGWCVRTVTTQGRA